MTGSFADLRCAANGRSRSNSTLSRNQNHFHHGGTNSRRSQNGKFLAVDKFEILSREIPRPAGESAGLRDDALKLRGELTPYQNLVCLWFLKNTGDGSKQPCYNSEQKANTIVFPSLAS